MRELSTKVTKLNVDVILRNFNKPEFWKKEWTIYSSRYITLYAKLSNIDLNSNLIKMDVYYKDNYVYCHKLRKNVWLWRARSEVAIPIDHPDYKKEKFERDLCLAASRVIFQLENYMIQSYSGYEEAVRLDDDYKEKLNEIANDFLDENYVTNFDIREAYIDKFVSDNEGGSNASEFLNSMQYTVIPYEYLMLTAFMGNEELYNEYAEKTNKTRGAARIKIWANRKKLESDEFVEEMRENLESI